MTKQEKIQRVKELKSTIFSLKKEVDYNNAMQLALKLVLNGSYGAFATQYFILFNNKVAGTITAEGRKLTHTMSDVNETYWYNIWHTDEELHKKMKIKNVIQIPETTSVSVYGDTDSIFVGFKGAIDSCEWKNQIFNENTLSNIPRKFTILSEGELDVDFNSDNFLGYATPDTISSHLDSTEILLVDGSLLKNWKLNEKLEGFKGGIFYNWKDELEFIHGLDKFKIADYFKDELTKHANSYGVDNIEDFELEKIAESIINLEKKKYIQHIVWEDGIDYKRLEYFQPKGVELVRSSTPVFARDKERGIPKLIKYLFSNADNFNIKELLKIVKEMRREFELSEIDSISMQSSCNKYNEKVIHDKEKLEFVSGAHFAVKAAAFHNHLLHKEPELQTKYEFLKSGDKIKYFYCKHPDHRIFAYHRGEYPIEFAPEIDYDAQFQKAILSPINSIAIKLGMPEISKRLSVVLDIFGSI
ncbi:MAG: gp110 [uncultured marine phage]|uniref:DNA-directed DNA polymerase n=1 Tax=uncultured marine phage TaxID=707152 RepID=A0A8D9CCH9_9VIRU|nr:MAG: gp110 [uncultured marine phage]